MTKNFVKKQLHLALLLVMVLGLLPPAAVPIFKTDIVQAQSPVTVTGLTSSTISFNWPAVTGATSYRIYLAPEPASLEVSAERKLVATVGSGVLNYQITSLAANTDLFIKIEAVGTNQYYTLYAKTLGGQGATLDSIITNGQSSTALKSVSLYAPNILLLVIEDKRAQSFSANSDTLDKGVNQLVNYTGATWQSGSWTVTRNNGSNISVSNVYRDSVPVGNFYDELVDNGNTWGGAQNSHLMDVEHYIYLKLNSTVGNKDILTISGPNSFSFTLPYSDQYLETPVIQLNQVGYNPRATERYAYISGWLGNGGALSLSNFPSQAKVLVESSDPLTARSAVVSNIAINTRSANDLISGTEVKDISLAAVPANDSAFYRVHLPGVGVSYRTMVSELATLKAYYVTTRGMFLNRWGRDLDCTYTDWCDRNPDHPTVFTGEQVNQGFFPQNTPQTGQRSLVGGHHDAGDFDLRIFHYTVARQMMRAYELNTNAFTDNQLNIPESGNGIPDFLDEILWNLAAWEQLQEADGGVRPGVESWRHPFGNYFADADPLPYWTYARNPIHSLRVAGLFAQASRLVSAFDSTKSEQLKNEAIAAYNYAVTADPSVNNIDGPIFYALSELYRVTGDEAYKNKFEELWETNEAFNTGMPSIRHLENWTSAYNLTTNQPIIADHVLGYLLSGSNDATTTAYLTLANNQFTTNANSQLAAIDNNYAHRNGLPAGWATAWGKSVAQGEYLMAIYSKMQLGTATAAEEQEYLNAISLASDYVLGGNPLGMSWVTGLGSRSPQNPLHNDSMAFQILNNLPPMPGIPIYGPADLSSAASYYDYGRNALYPEKNSRPTYRKFGDLRSFVATNEFTIWETQSNVTSLFATLIGGGLNIPTAWKPGQSDHKDGLPLDKTVQAASALVTYTPVCGNASVEGAEQCDDGNAVNGDGCSSVCLVTYQCNDSVDNDSDGKIDYPTDTGCASATDNNETNTTQGCQESWSCGSWSSCSNGMQTRTCVDNNSCGTTNDRPNISQNCSVAPTVGGGGGGGAAGPVDGTNPTTTDDLVDVPVVTVSPVKGNLVKTSNSAKVYLIGDDNKKHYIPTEGILRAHGYIISDIKQVTNTELDSYEAGSDLSYPALTLLKSVDNSAVYLFLDGKRKVFFNAKYFLTNNFSWNNIFAIPQTELNQFTLFENMKYPDGTLIKGDGIDVYLIDGGKRRKIDSEAVFNDLHFDWLNLIVTSPFELTFYIEGSIIDSIDDVSTSLITSLDSDNDRVYNYLEKIYGSNPTNTDTDGDGYSDYLEIKTGHDPVKSAN